MKKTKTSRGFSLVKFEDLYGAECSLQQSSLASQSALWLGIDNPYVKYLDNGWKDVVLPSNTNINSRMHLNRAQVRRLVKKLNKWLESGDL